jgi:hypothetical protein
VSRSTKAHHRTIIITTITRRRNSLPHTPKGCLRIPPMV